MFLPHPGFIPSFLSAKFCNTGLSRDASRSFSCCPVTPWVSFDLINFSKENSEAGLFSTATKSHCVVLSSNFPSWSLSFERVFLKFPHQAHVPSGNNKTCFSYIFKTVLNEKVIYRWKSKASLRVATSVFLGQRRNQMMRNLNFYLAPVVTSWGAPTAHIPQVTNKGQPLGKSPLTILSYIVHNLIPKWI